VWTDVHDFLRLTRCFSRKDTFFACEFYSSFTRIPDARDERYEIAE